MASHQHALLPLLPLLPLLFAGAALDPAHAQDGGADAAGSELPEGVPGEVPVPTAPGSALPWLSATPDGGLVLSWVESNASGGHALRFARWADGGWSPARTVAEEDAEGADWFVNWADVPSVVDLGGGRMAAHLLVKHPESEGPYGYDVRVLRSNDGGAEWSDGAPPHRDGLAVEHGFVSLLPSDERVLAVWLDGRETAGHGGGHGHGSGGAMTLRAAEVGAEDGLSREALLDARVCDCCPTSAAVTPDGVVVAYRDRSEEEVRDVAIVRRENGEWSRPRRVHADDWVIPGCPVDGPAAAASGERVAVAWYTGAGDEPRVQVAVSEDAGRVFGEPLVVDDGDPLGRADVVWIARDRVAVSWIERTPGRAELRVRPLRRGADGAWEAGPARPVARVWPTRATGFPRMAVAPADASRAGESALLLAWTDASEPSRVRTALVPVDPKD